MAILVENLFMRLGEQTILSDISFAIPDGQFLALTGRSGSGKSTLMYLMSSLDNPSEGRVAIDGRDLAALSSPQLHAFRNQEMGFVFQFHYLLPELTALENVLMPAMKIGQEQSRQRTAMALLEEMELADKAHRLPRHLSGGEQQRVSLARALLMEPRYLFADEPTGNLDSVSGRQVMELLARINRERATTVVMVTHDTGYAAMGQRQIELSDGRMVRDSLTEKKKPAAKKKRG